MWFYLLGKQLLQPRKGPAFTVKISNSQGGDKPSLGMALTLQWLLTLYTLNWLGFILKNLK